MQPEEQPAFVWEDSLAQARRALTNGDVNAAAALRDAFATAAQMTKHCEQRVMRVGMRQVRSNEFPDWEDFLIALSDDAEYLYPEHLDLLAEEGSDSLLNTFHVLSEGALDALLHLQAMNSSTKPTQSARKAAITALRSLAKDLQAAQVKVPQAAGAENTAAAEAPAKGDPAGEYPPEAAYVRLLGRIAAGNPNVAEEAVEDILPLPRQIVGEGEVFVLRVSGDSMIGAAIADGDLVVVRRQSTAEDGEIVVAMIEEEALVKTLKRSGKKVSLIAHNPLYPPIDGKHSTIIGKVVGLLRRM